MADLNTMKAAAASQGATAPPDYPGGPDAWVKDWYQNAVNAGSVKDESVTPAPGSPAAGEKVEGGGIMHDVPGGSSFADMIRQKAKNEHWSEDFARFSDAQIEAWKKFYDPASGKFWSENDPEHKYGSGFDKPAECPEGTTFHGSKCVSWDQLPPELGGTLGLPPGSKPSGAAGGGSAQPAAPTTFGSQLSYTGNPLTDMLLHQFNTGQSLSDPSQMNMFAMGADRQAGGEGAAADQQTRTGQLLQGGGLWWQEGGTASSPDKSTFGGFRADQKNAEPAAAAVAPATPSVPTPSGASTKAAPSAQDLAAPPSTEFTAGSTAVSQPSMTPIGNMLNTSFKPRETWRTRSGGTESPFNAPAF